MLNDLFVVHDGLAGAARFPPLGRSRDRISALEVLFLLGCGAAAASAVGLIRLRLGIPGHAIVLAALPMAFGMSMAPRRLAGCIMGAGALGTGALLATFGANYGSGSFVSLTLLGPMMDLALRGVRSGWRVYAALVLSGALTNLLALVSRGAGKLLGIDPGGRSFETWSTQAAFTYTTAGVIAGLLGAICWFHFRDRQRPAGTSDLA